MKHETARPTTRPADAAEVEGYTIFRVNSDTDPAVVVPRPITPRELPASRPVIFWA